MAKCLKSRIEDGMLSLVVNEGENKMASDRVTHASGVMLKERVRNDSILNVFLSQTTEWQLTNLLKRIMEIVKLKKKA